MSRLRQAQQEALLLCGKAKTLLDVLGSLQEGERQNPKVLTSLEGMTLSIPGDVAALLSAIQALAIEQESRYGKKS